MGVNEMGRNDDVIIRAAEAWLTEPAPILACEDCFYAAGCDGCRCALAEALEEGGDDYG
jgi:hypothetical protein